MTITIGQAEQQFGITVEDHLDRSLEIPVITGLPQRQGDVMIVPAPDRAPATTPVGAARVAVVRGEAGGNTHAIVAVGAVFCDVREASATNLTLATLTVTEGATAYLAHPEHAFNGIGAGTYELRRQREMADELRMVAD